MHGDRAGMAAVAVVEEGEAAEARRSHRSPQMRPVPPRHPPPLPLPLLFLGRRYGGTPDGLHKFAEEQTAAFTRCQARYGGRRCAFYFELLDADNSDVFFHCDQVLK